MTSLLVLSDIHFACEAERARAGHESRVIQNPLLRLTTRFYRRYVWLREPHHWNHLLTHVVERNPSPDLVIGNGDFTVDSAFVGVSDDAARASVEECLGVLRLAYGDRLRTTIGDHELGKMSMFGGVGGPRFGSWQRAVGDLGMEPIWRHEVENFVLIGVPSSLIALPVFAPEILADEWPAWERERETLRANLRDVFGHIESSHRIILFCHDPSALPFLYREEAVRARLAQVALTVIGHFHTPLVFRASRLLAGMPPVGFLGNTARRLSTALREARCWRKFKVVLCPSLTGCELLKDGGYLTVTLDREADEPPKVTVHPVPRLPRGAQ